MTTGFDDNFVWGASTASYQIEGAAFADGRGKSIWDTFCRTPGKVINGETGDVACDHYHKYPQDIALMQELGISAYRFSTAWPRIQPAGKGAVNHKGLDFYDRLTDAVIAADITPWLCLYHWDLPQELQDKGGWANRDTAKYFADYADIVVRKLADRVNHFATFNEPNVFTLLGNAWGIHAPGLTDEETTLATIAHVNLAHGLAIQAMRSHKSSLQLGVVNSMQPTRTASNSEQDKKAALLLDALWNFSFPDPQILGEYPDILSARMAPHLQDGDIKTTAQKLDWFGINHYSVGYAQHQPGKAFNLGMAAPPEGRPVTGMGWEIAPKAFTELLLDIRKRYGDIPVYITENGWGGEEELTADKSTVADSYRIDYLNKYLAAVAEANAKGANVAGYFAWSFLDNFEWAEGYSKRFGLVHVDYDSLERTPKQSFYYMQKVMEQNRVV